MANSYFSYTIPDFIAFTRIRSADMNSRFQQLSDSLNQGTAVGFTDQGSDPTTPSTGTTVIYTKNKKLYLKNDAGTVSEVGTGSSNGINYVSNSDFEVDASGWSAYSDTQTVTISVTSPAVFTTTSHGLAEGMPIILTTTGTLPTGFTVGTTYYVKVIDANTYNVSATLGGTAVNASGAGSGTHTTRPLRPLDATGGTATTTITRSTTNPLRGTASGLITKTGAILAGEGVSTSLTVANADKGATAEISFEYSPSTGTYVGGTDSTLGDLNVYIYDVTNAQIIQPITFKIAGSATGTAYKYNGSFQFNSTSTSYRLAIHLSSASASAFTMQLDTVSVSPGQTAVMGLVGTEWQEYSLQITGATTNPTIGTASINKALWKREGGDVLIRYDLYQTVGGTDGLGDYLFSLPPGLVIDSSRIPVGSIAQAGYVEILGGGSDRALGYVFVSDTTKFKLVVSQQSTGSNAAVSSSFYQLSVAPYELTVTARFPIVGWQSNLELSQPGNTAPVYAKYTVASAVASSTTQPIDFATKVVDSHGAVTTGSSWKFTAPYSDFYQISSTAQTDTNDSLLQLYKNGSADSVVSSINNISTNNGSTGVYLQLGEYIDLRFTVSQNTGSTAASNYIVITNSRGSQTVVASDEVVARYKIAADYTTTANQPIDYETKVDDTLSIVTTGASWQALATLPGYYEVGGILKATVATSGTVSLYKNGVAEVVLGNCNSTEALPLATVRVKVLAGDILDIRCDQAITLVGTATSLVNQIFIRRVK